MGKNTKLHTFIMSVFILCGIYALYTEPFNGQSIVLIGTLIVGIVAIVIINIQERLKMAEEKSKKLQITFNTAMIEKMEKRAESIGLTLNQYFTYVVATDIEKNLLSQKNESEK